LVKQEKSGEKVAIQKDEGLTTVRQAGVTSKFKSCFGEAPEIKKKPFKPSTDKKNRKRPISFFDS